MKERENSSYDIPITGKARYLTMEEMMDTFYSCKKADPETARIMIEYACDCGSIDAKLAYSTFLRTTPQLTMGQSERYLKAENLLLELISMLDASKSFTAKVALELGALYSECLHRPVGALGMYLYARRLGAHVEECELQKLQRKMEKMDINHLGVNCKDSLKLGQELLLSKEAPRMTELFLREAVDKSRELMLTGSAPVENIYAQACLCLADFYDCHISESIIYRIERDKMLFEARKHGFPEYLSVEKSPLQSVGTGHWSYKPSL